MKIKLLQAAVVNGSVWPVDAVVDVEDALGKETIDAGVAEVVPASQVIAEPLRPAGTSPKTGRKTLPVLEEEG